MTKSDNLEFVLTAPGKIILFGEHSVVYGKKAVAATLGLYTKLHFTENDSECITVKFPSIGLEETFDVKSVREYFKANDGLSVKDHVQLSAENFQNFYSKYGSKPLTDGQRYSLITLFTCFSYFTGACTGFSVRVETELPVSSGAGSSASFSVVITTAMLLLELAKTNKLSEHIRNGGCEDFSISSELMEIISKRAFTCESIFHGTPSGIDHSVILHGNVLEFVKGVSSNTIVPVDGGTVKVLLVDTKVPRSTKKQVEILRRWKESFPAPVDSILDAMEGVAQDAIRTLQDMKKNPKGITENEHRLAGLIELNHGLLRSVGVSHDSLEKVCSAAKNHGLSAKLTGAGGGGLSYVYLPGQTSALTVSKLKEVIVLGCSLAMVIPDAQAEPGVLERKVPGFMQHIREKKIMTFEMPSSSSTIRFDPALKISKGCLYRG